MLQTKPAPQQTPGLWASIREAVAGSRQDFTEGSIERAIVLLAVPMVLEVSMESLFGIVDMFWVAHLGADAMATVGLTETGISVLFCIAMGLGTGATAIVARRVGEKDEKAASEVAVQAIALGVIASLITSCVGYVFAPDLLGVLGASESVIHNGSHYTRMILGGSITIFQLFLINAVFRGAGDAATAMRTLWIANAVNILLNPCLILGLGPFPRLGLLGSAVGTTIGRGTGVLYQLWILSTGRSRIKVGWADVRVDLRLIWRLVRLSFTATCQFLVQLTSWIGVVRIISSFGSAAVAGNTLAVRIFLFALLPSWGLSNAGATLVGQNLGAGKPDRAAQSVWRTGLYNMLFLGAAGLLFIVFAEPLIRLFTTDPEVVPLAATGLRYFSYAYPVFAWGMVVSNAFNGAGDAATPTWLNLICFWVCQIPLAYALAIPGGMGPRGAYSAILIAQIMLAILSILLFRRGKWKRRVV